MTKLLPATLETTRPGVGEPRTAKVRIYADPGVRALPRSHDPDAPPAPVPPGRQ